MASQQRWQSASMRLTDSGSSKRKAGTSHEQHHRCSYYHTSSKHHTHPCLQCCARRPTSPREQNATPTQHSHPTTAATCSVTTTPNHSDRREHAAKHLQYPPGPVRPVRVYSSCDSVKRLPLQQTTQETLSCITNPSAAQTAQMLTTTPHTTICRCASAHTAFLIPEIIQSCKPRCTQASPPEQERADGTITQHKTTRLPQWAQDDHSTTTGRRHLGNRRLTRSCTTHAEDVVRVPCQQPLSGWEGHSRTQPRVQPTASTNTQAGSGRQTNRVGFHPLIHACRLLAAMQSLATGERLLPPVKTRVQQPRSHTQRPRGDTQRERCSKSCAPMLCCGSRASKGPYYT